jgi:hypothetical protein
VLALAELQSKMKKKKKKRRGRKEKRRGKEEERERRKEKEEKILCIAPDSTMALTANAFISDGLVYGRAFMF